MFKAPEVYWYHENNCLCDCRTGQCFGNKVMGQPFSSEAPAVTCKLCKVTRYGKPLNWLGAFTAHLHSKY